jgi:hypothetical protein
MAMKGDQYDALVRLMRGKPESPACKAARRVLVDGISQADAVREAGITRGTVSKAVRSYTEADQLMRAVYGANRG